MFKDTWIINIYAPSGAEKRQEIETFFAQELAYLLPACSQEMLLAGDSNCVTSPSDCPGKPNFSKALSSKITGFALHDVCETLFQGPPYTHYTNDGATRIDIIYLTDPLQK